MKSARAKLFVPFLITLLTFSTHAIANGGGGGGGADVVDTSSSAKASDVPESVYEHAARAGQKEIYLTDEHGYYWAFAMAKMFWTKGNPIFDANDKRQRDEDDAFKREAQANMEKERLDAEAKPVQPTKTASKENVETQHQKDVDKLIAESIEKSKTSSKYRARMQKLADKGNMHAKKIIAALEIKTTDAPNATTTTRPADSIFNAPKDGETRPPITRESLKKEFGVSKIPVKTASANKTGVNQIN